MAAGLLHTGIIIGNSPLPCYYGGRLQLFLRPPLSPWTTRNGADSCSYNLFLSLTTHQNPPLFFYFCSTAFDRNFIVDLLSCMWSIRSFNRIQMPPEFNKMENEEFSTNYKETREFSFLSIRCSFKHEKAPTELLLLLLLRKSLYRP